MEKRRCSNLHFINAIKGNLVTKLRNVDTFGNPTLVFKTVKEIMEADDSKRLQPSTSPRAQCLDQRFSCVRVKIESKGNEFIGRGGYDEMGSDSDEDNSGKMTLKQLKEKFKTKKRKQCSKSEPIGDDSDLKESLSSFKLKIPTANKKRVKAASGSPKVENVINSEQNQDPQIKCHRELSLIDHVKTEVPESVINGCLQIIPFVDCQNSMLRLCGEQYQSCCFNEESYDHFENFEPISMLLPSCEDTMDLDSRDESCREFQDLPTSECETEEIEERPLLIDFPTNDDNSYMNNVSINLIQIHEFVEQTSHNHAFPVSDMVVDDRISGEDLDHGSDSLLFVDEVKKYLASDRQVDASSNPPRNISEPRNHLFLSEDKSTLDELEQTRMSTTIGEEIPEINSPPENQNCDDSEKLSISERVQPPERLLLTRKVMSPTSQERLCLAMSSTESDMNQKSKDHPCLSKQTENNTLLGSDVKQGNVAGNPKGSGVVDRTKVSPTRILKRSKSYKRNSPPKGNVEGPRLSRSLPNFSTGSTSLQDCSKSAIAFSQRQMQDIESLAMKLMSELNYMKDIVEEKLLFEAYRNVSTKNDADEVKNAITNAGKVEETSRKWLSIMARDCNRFCKIMSLTQKSTPPAPALATANGEIPKERRKITFADEAGGKLCHIKVFGDEMTLKSNNEK